MVSTATKIGAFDFDNCLMNAAGVYCMTREELAEIEASTAGSFVTKTGTLAARPGNPEPRYADTALGSINSMGLPNNGFQYYLDYVTELQNTPNSKNHFKTLHYPDPIPYGPHRPDHQSNRSLPLISENQTDADFLRCGQVLSILEAAISLSEDTSADRSVQLTGYTFRQEPQEPDQTAVFQSPKDSRPLPESPSAYRNQLQPSAYILDGILTDSP